MKKFRSVLNLVLGNLLLAAGVSYFIVPFEILSGGMAGVAVAISPIVPLSIQAIINIIILITFVLGAIFLGKEFVLKTIVSSILFPLFIELLNNFPVAIDISPVLASVYSGVTTGLGLGLIFRQGGSSGGMDVFPLILHKYTHIRVATLVQVVDGITVLLGLYTYGIEAVLIGFLSVYASGVVIDKVVVAGGMHAKTVYIISDHYELILDRIHNELDRGATIIAAKGGYTGREKNMILSVVPANQYPMLQHIVDSIDEEAFIVVNDATEVKGEGFSIEPKI
ncbi:MAG TPA: YitT family protein [Erysipelothrix sp.]|jgi:uncharacterized membrane-anchored protein YitT (DUF2179 family)|nr:YitT family protein [Erysipelothrix sp.]